MKQGHVFLKKLPKQILQYAILLLGAFCALVPIVSCVTTAFKNDEEYRTTSVMTLPESWLNFENFKVAWEKADMGKAFLNSFLILVCVLVLSLGLGAGGQYHDFRHAGICAEPIPVPRQSPDSQSVHGCGTDPGNCHTGHRLSDHDGSASGQYALRLHFPDAWD